MKTNYIEKEFLNLCLFLFFRSLCHISSLAWDQFLDYLTDLAVFLILNVYKHTDKMILSAFSRLLFGHSCALPQTLENITLA